MLCSAKFPPPLPSFPSRTVYLGERRRGATHNSSARPQAILELVSRGGGGGDRGSLPVLPHITLRTVWSSKDLTSTDAKTSPYPARWAELTLWKQGVTGIYFSYSATRWNQRLCVYTLAQPVCLQGHLRIKKDFFPPKCEFLSGIDALVICGDANSRFLVSSTRSDHGGPLFPRVPHGIVNP